MFAPVPGSTPSAILTESVVEDHYRKAQQQVEMLKHVERAACKATEAMMDTARHLSEAFAVMHALSQQPCISRDGGMVAQCAHDCMDQFRHSGASTQLEQAGYHQLLRPLTEMRNQSELLVKALRDCRAAHGKLRQHANKPEKMAKWSTEVDRVSLTVLKRMRDIHLMSASHLPIMVLGGLAYPTRAFLVELSSSLSQCEVDNAMPTHDLQLSGHLPSTSSQPMHSTSSNLMEMRSSLHSSSLDTLHFSAGPSDMEDDNLG